MFYRKIREVISYHLVLEADEVFDGQIELDESYFGGHRKGKRGRGAAGKVAVFGLLKRQVKVFTVVVENTKTETLMPVIVRKNFWSQAKRILRKYNGINRKNFTLFLKECEFRFNFGALKEQFKILRKWCNI